MRHKMRADFHRMSGRPFFTPCRGKRTAESVHPLHALFLRQRRGPAPCGGQRRFSEAARGAPVFAANRYACTHKRAIRRNLPPKLERHSIRIATKTAFHRFDCDVKSVHAHPAAFYHKKYTGSPPLCQSSGAPHVPVRTAAVFSRAGRGRKKRRNRFRRFLRFLFYAFPSTWFSKNVSTEFGPTE